MSSAAAQNPSLQQWLAQVSEALGLEDVDAPVDPLLDVSRDVAHGVTRPAVPITMYLLGYAAGQRGSVADSQADFGRLSALVQEHQDGTSS